MTTLSEALLEPSAHPLVVADLVTVVNQEVADKSGFSGAAIKTAFAAVRKVSPDVVDSAIERLLPDFAAALDPFWADFSGNGDFGEYLAGRGDEAGNALLAVTDRRAESTSRTPLRKAYGAIRPKALGNVIGALPRLGAVIQKHAGGR